MSFSGLTSKNGKLLGIVAVLLLAGTIWTTSGNPSQNAQKTQPSNGARTVPSVNLSTQSSPNLSPAADANSGPIQPTVHSETVTAAQQVSGPLNIDPPAANQPASSDAVFYNGWLDGTANMYPTCAAARPGQSCSRPYQGKLRATNKADGTTTDFSSDSNGHFRIALAPGSYTLITLDNTPFARPAEFEIHSNQTTTKDFYFETGIR